MPPLNALPVDAGTFMVPPEQKEIILVFHLVSQKQTDCLQGILASVRKRDKYISQCTACAHTLTRGADKSLAL
jgi:hypothetical protein